MDTIKVLNDMKDVLMEKGWCKTTLEAEDGRVCLVGARNKVLGYAMFASKGGYRADYTSDLLESVVTTPRDEDSEETRVWIFNDACSSLNQVLDAIDLAIYTEKGRGQ